MLVLVSLMAFTRGAGVTNAVAWGDAGYTGTLNVVALAYYGEDDVLYAGTWNNGHVYAKQSPTGGSAWQDTGPTGTPGLQAMAIDEIYGVVFAAGERNGSDPAHVFMNKFQGGGWTDIGAVTTTGCDIYCLTYDSDRQDLYAGANNGHVYRNDDPLNGVTWIDTGSAGGFVQGMAYDGTNRILYAGIPNGHVYRNTNPSGGGGWNDAGYTGYWSAQRLAHDGTNLYASSGSSQPHVCRNTNPSGGTTWTDMGGLGTNTIDALAFDTDHGVLYAGNNNGHVYMNFNPSVSNTWTDTGDTTGGQVSAFSNDSLNGIIYAGTNNGHVYYRSSIAHSITVTQGANGTITPGGVVTVNDGANQTFNIAANDHYQIADVVVDGTNHLGPVSSHTFNNVTEDHTITALFTRITHSITVTQGANGTITPGGVVTVNDGANQTFNIAADSNYHVADVLVDGSSVGPVTSYTFSNVTSDHTVAGTFAQNQQPASSTWYLAEGTTAWGFSTYISIQNPNESAVNAKVTYMPKGGSNVTETLSLPAMSQTTLTNDHLTEKMGGQMDFSTKVEATDNTKPIAVDRTMEWTGAGAASPEGHSSVGVTSPAKTWYLPEGSTNWNFATWLLIQNPNGGKATCKVTYMIEGEAPKEFTKEVPANSRESFSMQDDIGNKDASIKVESDVPVIPERAMYRNNRREGHDSIGTTSPAQDYYLAEGTTAWGFTTYVLVQNPSAQTCDVTITYMTSSGAQPQASFPMSGNSRKTIRVNDVPGMGSTDFSTAVHGSQPIIAERAMYWGADTPQGEACHDSIGMASAHMTFYLPDGQSSEGRETWTLVQNPNGTPVQVTISYLLAGGGTPVTFTDTIPANSRKTYNMADKGVNGRAAVLVQSAPSGRPIMCERAMYWNNRGAGTDTIGGYSD